MANKYSHITNRRYIRLPRAEPIPRIGVGGRNTDKPSWALRPDELNDGSQDAIVHEGAIRRRRGVKVGYSFGATVLGETGRYSFALTGRTVIVSSTFSGGTLQYWQSATGEGILATGDLGFSNARVVPRAVYRDEVLICSQGGLVPLVRYAGGRADVTITIAGITVAGNSTLTATPTADLNLPVGQYARLGRRTVGTLSNPLSYARVLSAAATTVTIEDMRASLVQTMATTTSVRGGRTAPVVAIYNAGTVSIVGATSIATGSGTRWEGALSNESDFATHLSPVGMLVNAAGTYRSYDVDDTVVPTDTSLRVYGADGTNLNYALTARCPFKDVCVHNERLYGVGVAQYPSRVYVGPAGWDMAYPPGATLPFDPTVEFTSTNPQDFLLDFIDVPSPFDSDEVVAILATAGPRIVLKTKAVYRLDGEPPYLQPTLMVGGDGCIDIRSAISVPEGAFWAGREGVYQYTGGTYPRNLMGGWMVSEWRALVQAGVDTCTLGTDGRFLIVSIKTADAAQQKRTYLYDLQLQRWMPEITNIHPRHIFTTRISDEITQMLAVDDAYSGKILNIRPALDLTGPARDEVGTGPNFRLQTGEGLVANDGIDGESRVLEVAVNASVRDPAATTTLAVKAKHGGTLRGDGAALYGAALYGAFYYGPDGGKTLGNLTQDTDDVMRRQEFVVNRLARRMGLVIEETTTSATVEQVEVGEVVVRMRDTRRGT